MEKQFFKQLCWRDSGRAVCFMRLKMAGRAHRKNRNRKV